MTRLTRRPKQSWCAARVGAVAGMICAIATGAAGSGNGNLFPDATGDARTLRTDLGADGPLLPNATLPDLIGVEVAGWEASNPAADRYAGSVTGTPSPDLVRIAVQFDGLVSPPGPIGLGGQPYDPTRFGASPAYGFVEFDMDSNPNTGGEDRAVAIDRYLANAGRFASTPQINQTSRLVLNPGDADSSFGSPPQYERTGADFVLALCGCWDVNILNESGTPDGTFDAGDTWIVEGRFLERAQGFDGLSSMFGNAALGGPSSFGLYDPVTQARYSHDISTNQTTLELVFPMTPDGAKELVDEDAQNLDFTFGNGNHFSIEEALTDLIIGAASASGIDAVLGGGWAGVDLHDHNGPDPLDPSRWTARALVGTTYATPQPDALYVWTDAASGEVPGDINGDGNRDAADLVALTNQINSLDGTSDDDDGTVNGQVAIAGFGTEFSVFDVDYDGVLGPADIMLAQPVRADVAAPFGVLDQADLDAALGPGQNQPFADFNLDGTLDGDDTALFLAWFQAGHLFGDFDNSGQVEQGDLDLLLLNWGQGFASLPANWINDRPTQGIVGQTQLDQVLLHWGNTSEPDPTGGAVPEPGTLAVVILGLGTTLLRRSPSEGAM